jgi:hypothetical protein
MAQSATSHVIGHAAALAVPETHRGLVETWFCAKVEKVRPQFLSLRQYIDLIA